jgi:hypothetical protein
VRSGIGSLLNEVTAASKQQKTWPPRGHTRCRCEWRWDKRLRWFCCCIWAGRCTGDSQPTCKKCNKRQSQQPKLVFLLRFRSVFFSINLENVTILHFVVTLSCLLWEDLYRGSDHSVACRSFWRTLYFCYFFVLNMCSFLTSLLLQFHNGLYIFVAGNWSSWRIKEPIGSKQARITNTVILPVDKSKPNS